MTVKFAFAVTVLWTGFLRKHVHFVTTAKNISALHVTFLIDVFSPVIKLLKEKNYQSCMKYALLFSVRNMARKRLNYIAPNTKVSCVNFAENSNTENAM